VREGTSLKQRDEVKSVGYGHVRTPNEPRKYLGRRKYCHMQEGGSGSERVGGKKGNQRRLLGQQEKIRGTILSGEKDCRKGVCTLEREGNGTNMR